MIALKLQNGLQNSHGSRDMTLSRAFLLLSISWMTLWAPLIIYKTVYGFVDRPYEFTISFGYVASSPRFWSRPILSYDQTQSSAHPCVPRPKLQGLESGSSAQ